MKIDWGNLPTQTYENAQKIGNGHYAQLLRHAIEIPTKKRSNASPDLFKPPAKTCVLKKLKQRIHLEGEVPVDVSIGFDNITIEFPPGAHLVLSGNGYFQSRYYTWGEAVYLPKSNAILLVPGATSGSRSIGELTSGITNLGALTPTLWIHPGSCIVVTKAGLTQLEEEIEIDGVAFDLATGRAKGEETTTLAEYIASYVVEA